MAIKWKNTHKDRPNKNRGGIILFITVISIVLTLLSAFDLINNAKDYYAKSFFRNSCTAPHIASVVNEIIQSATSNANENVTEDQLIFKRRELTEEINEKVNEIEYSYNEALNYYNNEGLEKEKERLINEKNQRVEELKNSLNITNEELKEKIIQERVEYVERQKENIIEANKNIIFYVNNSTVQEEFSNLQKVKIENEAANWESFRNHDFFIEAVDGKINVYYLGENITASFIKYGYIDVPEGIVARFAIDDQRLLYGEEDEIKYLFMNYNKMENLLEIEAVLIGLFLPISFIGASLLRKNRHDPGTFQLNLAKSFSKLPFDLMLTGVLICLALLYFNTIEQLRFFQFFRVLKVENFILLFLIIMSLFLFSNIKNKKDYINSAIVKKAFKAILTLIGDKPRGRKILIVTALILILLLSPVLLIIITFGIYGEEMAALAALATFYALIIIITARIIYKRAKYLDEIIKASKEIAEGNVDNKIEVRKNSDLSVLAENINNIKQGLKTAVLQELKSERLKTELITNVSHDLKTPLTSIISYIDLMKKEDISPDVAVDYLKVLDKKAERLKFLIDDLFEATKTATGAVELNIERLELKSLLNQTLAEFENKIQESGLIFKINLPEDKVYVMADGLRLYRVFANLISNAIKYSLRGSRVYIDLVSGEDKVQFIIKNISSYEMNFDAEEITERFKRGDEARSTDGSGLGLAIAKNIMELHGGSLKIEVDGDLFKGIVTI